MMIAAQAYKKKLIKHPLNKKRQYALNTGNARNGEQTKPRAQQMHSKHRQTQT